MPGNKKTRRHLTPLARRLYDLQLEARSLEVKLGNLIPKVVQAEIYADALMRSQPEPNDPLTE